MLGFQFLPTPIAGANAPVGDYIVLLTENADLQTKISKEARLGNSISDVYGGSANGFVAELDAADVRRLKSDRDVLIVELDRVIRLDDDSVTTSSSSSSSSSSTTTTTIVSTTTSTTSSSTSTTTPTSTSTTSSSSSTTSSTTSSSSSTSSTTSTTSTTVPATTSSQDPLEGTSIVMLRPDVDVQAFVAAENALGGEVIQAFTQAISGYVALLSESQIARLSKDPRVASIEPNQIIEIEGDQASPPSWGLDRIDQRARPLNSLYTYNFGGAGVTAYVIDTGIRADHVEFSGRVVSGFGAIADGYGSTDCNGHGTHVAGTIGGSTTGVAKSTRLVPVRVLNCRGSGALSNVISGLNWVITDHAAGTPAVANLSLGGGLSSAFNTAIANAVADGITVVVAAGNNNRLACSYSPASAPSAITVGATTSADARASYSNYGSCLDIFAPGSGITSAYHTSSTALRSLSGTSMAAPHVAGAAALLLEADPTMTPAAVATKLTTYATPDVVSSQGAGSINLFLYTKSAWLAPTPVAPSTPRDLTVVAGDSSVALTWLAPTTDNGSSVTDYLIEFSSNSGSTWSTFNDGVSTSTSATVTGLTNATSYSFRVKAVSSVGTSDASNVISTTPGIPGEPTSLRPTALNQSVRLTWAAPSLNGGSAVTDYLVEYTTDLSAGYLLFDDGVSTSTTATVTGLTNGTSYFFRVKAVNTIGTGQPSGVASGAPWAIVVPSAPVDVRVTNIELNQIALSWTAPVSDGGSSVSDYLIEYSSNAGLAWATFADPTSTIRSTTVTGLVNATSYIFRVSAINISGTGAASTATTAVAPGIPSAPCCVNDVSIGPRRVAIQWGAPTFNGGSELTNYIIEYSKDNGTTWTTWDGNTGVVGCVCANVARTVSPLEDGVPHIFRVRAKNAIGIGEPSEPSEAFTPWTPVVPGAPRTVAATARTGQVDLDWEEPTTDGGAPISDYTIQYSVDSGVSWTTLSDGVSASTFSVIRSLAAGVSHIFRVSATNEVGTGTWSTQSSPITTISALAHDPFSGAIAVTGATGNFNSSTLTATRETGEPNHGGYAPSASIWYKWVATEAGTLVLTTSGSDFDTILGAYTGASVNALTMIAVNDDAPGETGLWSRVSITVSAGDTYFAAIDGYSGKKGATRFNWTFTPAPTPQVPDAPRSVRAGAGNATATVNWLPPLSDGYSTITEYVVTSTPGSKSCSTTGALSCVVRGLTNGVSYTFAVTATNAIGTSVPSSASDAIVPSVDSDAGVAALSWGLDRIDQRNLPLNSRYISNFSGAGVNAYIIDTGVLSSHTEFGSRVVSGFSSVADGRGTQDCNGHGTHVAGTVAGSNYGVAPSANVVPVRVLDCAGSGSTSGVIAGIDWVVAHHESGVPAVANMSLGGSRSAALDLAVARGVADGIVFVVAAGNSNANACNYSPAAEESAITVGATTSTDVRASYSNFGSCVDVFAPGSNITSAWYTSTTATNTISGTSMASPHVAGIAALALSADPSLSVSRVTTWITSTATSDVVADPAGSPNKLVYSLLSSTPPAQVIAAPTIPPPSSGGGGGGGGGGSGGGGGGGGSAPTTTVPPTTVPPSTVPPTAPVNQAPPATLPSNNSGGSNNNSVRQPSLGQPMPPIAENTPRIAALTRAVGNAVTFRVKARPGATVNIYRNGILVSSVPWSAALALKVTDNPSGENSYQVVVVGKNGKISISSKTTVVTKLNSRAGNKRDSKNNRVVAPKKSVKGKAVAPKKSTLQSKASTNKSSK